MEKCRSDTAAKKLWGKFGVTSVADMVDEMHEMVAIEMYIAVEMYEHIVENETIDSNKKGWKEEG